MTMANPRWKVSGANAETGEEATIVICAPTEEGATKHARSLGLLVSGVVAEAGDLVDLVDPVERDDTLPIFAFRAHEAFRFGFYAAFGFVAASALLAGLPAIAYGAVVYGGMQLGVVVAIAALVVLLAVILLRQPARK